jgi:hypothetical protein
MIEARFSLAPLGDPGRVMIKVLFRTPATGRAITATAVRKLIYFRLWLNGLQVVTAREAASIPCLHQYTVSQSNSHFE